VNDQPPQQSKRVLPLSRRTLKCSVPLDQGTHARLAAAAALRGCSQGTLMARFIKAGLKGIIVIDKDGRRNLSSNGDSSDRQGDEGEISSDAENAA